MWGGLFVLVLGLVALFGVKTGPLEGEQGNLTDSILAVIQAVVGLIVVIERILNKYKNLRLK